PPSRACLSQPSPQLILQLLHNALMQCFSLAHLKGFFIGTEFKMKTETLFAVSMMIHIKKLNVSQQVGSCLQNGLLHLAPGHVFSHRYREIQLNRRKFWDRGIGERML